MKDYRLVKHKGKSYYVCRYIADNKYKLFVIDKEDLIKIMEVGTSWTNVGGCIGHMQTISNNTCYIHDFIMDNEDSDVIVHHKNGIKYDNRKSNLILMPKAIQYGIRSKKDRTDNLPKNCGIKMDDLPMGIYYESSKERFIVRLKINGKPFREACTSDKRLTLKARLEVAKEVLIKLLKENDDDIKNDKILNGYTDQEIRSIKEFNNIILNSDYKCYKNNLANIPKKKVLKKDTKKLTKMEKAAVNNKRAKGRRAVSNIPAESGITTNDLPEHCYYKPAAGKNGDYFYIKKHPNLPEGTTVRTSAYKTVSIQDKYRELMEKYNELEKKKIKKPIKKKIKKSTYGSKTNKKNKK